MTLSNAADNPVPAPLKRANRVKTARIAALLLLLTALASIAPLTAWQRRDQRDAVSLNNLRRLGQGLLIYAQDWDERPMPPALKVETANQTQWHTWPQSLLPYLPDKATLDNPSNPLAKETTDPTGVYPVMSAYALNSRFYNTFGIRNVSPRRPGTAEQNRLVPRGRPFAKRPATSHRRRKPRNRPPGLRRHQRHKQRPVLLSFYPQRQNRPCRRRRTRRNHSRRPL